MPSQQWGSPLLLVPGGRQKGHTSWWSRNSRLLVIYWPSDRVPGTRQPVGERWRTQFMSWPSAPLLIIYQVHLSGCGTQAVKSHFRHLATAKKKKKNAENCRCITKNIPLVLLFVFFFLGCWSTAVFYFMPSISAAVFCCGLLTWVIMSCSPECWLL